MDASVVVGSADEVRARIASLVLGEQTDDVALGEIRLTKHQAEAVGRVRKIIAEFGGALLCDVVGSGKTYIALSVARFYEAPLIVAPAILREMWETAMAATRVVAGFASTESLSRRAPRVHGADCVIVDEAHHFRNRSTRRFGALSEICAHRPVLLLTATPIHNSRRDLDTLASLFLGSRAETFSDSELARMIVRRQKARLASAISIPSVREMEPLPSGDHPALVQALLSLPPPVPFRAAGEAAFLVAHGLIRQWASSEAALKAAIKRRIARALVLETSLEAGEYPSIREMTSWIAGDDAVQLGFPGLFGPEAISGSGDLLPAIRAHADALRAICSLISGNLDAHKADLLRRLAALHPAEPIVAFASYDATVAEMFRRLNGLGHVAALTSHGGRIAGGHMSRREVVSQFSPSARNIPQAERIDLLLTTDLLSEGINLQRAATVVHLDIPWTFARMEQRVGRLARAGSAHDTVRVFTFSPPHSANEMVRATRIVAAKRETAANVIGRDDYPNAPVPRPSAPEQNEAVRTMLGRWRRRHSRSADDFTLVGSTSSARAGFLAVVSIDAGSILLGSDGGRPCDSITTIHEILSRAHGPDTEVDPAQIPIALASIREWLDARASEESAGLCLPRSRHARKKLLARIDSLTARMSPVERVVRAPLLLRARRSAASFHGAWGERQIELLANACDHPRNDWLEQIAELGEVQAGRAARPESCRIRALLLLVEPTPAPAS